MLNQVVITGNITRDIEIRNAGANAMARFTVACTRSYVPKNGERVTDFIDVVAFGKNAEIIAKNFGKGRAITVIGELHIDRLEKDGETRYATSVVLNNFEFVPRDNGNAGGNNGGERRQNNNNTYAPRRDMTPVDDDEASLPF